MPILTSRICSIAAAGLLLSLGQGKAFAQSQKEKGVQMGVTVTLSAALATCRAIKGDGSDWLDYYFQRLGANRRAIASFMTLPEKLFNQRVQEAVAYFGSCDGLLLYEQQNGVKAFTDVIVPELARKTCRLSGGC